MSKTALITGITGQDGSYLAELLLDQGYEVHGMVRRSHASIFSLVDKLKPGECYHLAAQSFVNYSFEDAFSTFDTNINGTLHLLSSIKDRSPGTRFYFAATSEMFGKSSETPQRESTPFHPRSPYGISKVTGFDVVRNFRESYNLFACSGILFNHESPRRGFEFVTRKITSSVARIKAGLQQTVALGNLEPRRDWGFAGDYVRAMKLMLEQQEPDDYVVATGETHSVRDFAELAFARVGLDWKDHVVIDERFYRPAEVAVLQGDSSKARKKLGWTPTVNFKQLVEMMVDADMAGLAEGRFR